MRGGDGVLGGRNLEAWSSVTWGCARWNLPLHKQRLLPLQYPKGGE